MDEVDEELKLNSIPEEPVAESSESQLEIMLKSGNNCNETLKLNSIINESFQIITTVNETNFPRENEATSFNQTITHVDPETKSEI